MKTHPGYPLKIGGTQKYEKKNISLVGGALQMQDGDIAMVAGSEALGQYIEQAIRKAKPADVDAAEAAMKAFVQGDDWRAHFDSVVAFRSADRTVEVDFIAVGYPQRTQVVKF